MTQLATTSRQGLSPYKRATFTLVVLLLVFAGGWLVSKVPRRGLEVLAQEIEPIVRTATERRG